MGKSNRNILDRDSGFNIRVNLYIIRYMYSHMEKADVFMVNTNGKRRTSIDVYEYVVISRQRFARMLQGKNFELTKTEKDTIIGYYNINKDYFEKNGEIIPVHYFKENVFIRDITREDWECYFAQQYGKESVGEIIMPDEEIKERIKILQDALSDIVGKDYVPRHYDTAMPLYRIYYFFAGGHTFKEVSTLNKFLDSLERLRISDWEELAKNPIEIKKYLPLLKRHYEYIDAYIKCIEYEKAD